MSDISTKPKLLFFQYKYGKQLPEFVRSLRQYQVRCLGEFFEVVVIQEDCDYQQVCDAHCPDLTLFEMLGDTDRIAAHQLTIKSVSKCRDIPRLALLNADAWSGSRASFISDMARLEIETAFSICVTAAEHTPGMADNLFVWPNFVDPEVHRDYGENKIIPVLFTGATTEPYPWRRSIYKVVSEVYPTMRCPHHGYTGRAPAFRMIHGESYARTINASWFVPTCGTVAMEVLRKHFEIPACKSCLITESSPGLVAAGFRDMENCVFASPENILEKLDYLFQRPEEIERITESGHRLVHTRHTPGQRDQIYQWFKLHRGLKVGQRIVQPNPFEAPVVVEESRIPETVIVKANGVHLVALHQGDAMLWKGRINEARALYERSSSYIPWGMPEPKFKLALCNLYKGDAKAAYGWLIRSVNYTLTDCKAIDPDPVEWAYCIIALLCLGKLDVAAERAAQFPQLRHPELVRVRWVVDRLFNPRHTCSALGVGVDRPSIHQLPGRTHEEWLHQTCLMLNACGQSELATRLVRPMSLTGDETSKPRRRCNLLPKLRCKSEFYILRLRGVCGGIRSRIREQCQQWLNRSLHNE